MSLSMYQASVPPMLQSLAATVAVLAKGAAHAEARKIDPSALLLARLFPDQFTLTKQVQIMSDLAKLGGSKLSGTEAPKMPDTETGFAELQARLEATADYLRSITPAQIDGTEAKVIAMKLGGTEVSFTGQSFLLHFIMPNVYFHATTAYALLRHNGVELGKRDFIGAMPA